MELLPERVKRRSVLTAAAPLYCSVPPERTRFPAALPLVPMELAAPPLAITAAFKVPAAMVVTPE